MLLFWCRNRRLYSCCCYYFGLQFGLCGAQPFWIDSSKGTILLGPIYLLNLFTALFFFLLFFFSRHYINFHLPGSALTSVVSHFAIYILLYFFFFLFTSFGPCAETHFDFFFFYSICYCCYQCYCCCCCYVLSEFLVHVSFRIFYFTFYYGHFCDKGVRRLVDFIRYPVSTDSISFCP